MSRHFNAPMRIVVVSDTHLAQRATSLLENWWALARWIIEARPDLVLHLGDISLDGASNPADLRESARIITDLEIPFPAITISVTIRSHPVRPATIRSILGASRNTASCSGPIVGR
jgi:hypothetical protein